ncbi:MAG: GspL/Epsl periplasmic domain-containing protein [Phycisphaerae bacterium]
MAEQYTIAVGDKGWRVAAVSQDGDVRVSPVPASDDAGPEAPAEAAAEALRELGYAGEPAVLAVPSSWCLCAEISTDDLQRGGRRKAMAYRLEEHLPVSAEDFVADFVEMEDHQALGVCAELETLRPIVSALETGEVHVRHICPAALLAAAWAVEQHPGAGGVLIGGAAANDADAADDAEPSSDGYDLIRLREGRPTAWAWIVEGNEAVRERLEAWEMPDEQPLPLVLVGAHAPLRAAAGAAGTVDPVETDAVGRHEAAARRAARVAAGAVSPWIDLRRDALAAPGRYDVYRKPVTALVAAAAILLVSLVGVVVWRGRQYEALAGRYVRQQAEVFRKVLPDQRVPGSVKGRLGSERRKLEGLGGHASDEATAPSVSALVHLREVLGRLPKDIRYRILDLNVQPDRIRIDGQARSHAEAERLAVALRESEWYDVQPPKTEALKDRGVSFLFTAEPRRTLAPSEGNAE